MAKSVHKHQDQPSIANQAVASSQLSSVEIGICGAVAGMVSRFITIDTMFNLIYQLGDYLILQC